VLWTLLITKADVAAYSEVALLRRQTTRYVDGSLAHTRVSKCAVALQDRLRDAAQEFARTYTEGRKEL
jgi:hypothetical protein